MRLHCPALLLASVGLYSLLAFLVTERTNELGIRIALGEQLGRLTRSVVGGGLGLVALGVAIGVGASLVLFRLGETLLFGVTSYDAWTYAAVLVIRCAVAGIASYVLIAAAQPTCVYTPIARQRTAVTKMEELQGRPLKAPRFL